MTVWFTSDLHFGHLKVSEIRGFGTPMQHDFALIKNWERVVRKNDQVWVLGDLAVSSPTRALEIVAALPGRKHLISGNHDACHPMHRNSHKYLRRYLEAFDSVQPFARRRIEGREVLLSHFPYAAILSPISEGPEWRETPYDGYFANVEGQIRGKFGRVLKPWIAGAGYEYVAVMDGNKKRNVTVHSLVCHAFHGERPEGKQVAHNDGDLSNNRASNLRWATPKENMADQHRHETFDGMKSSQPGEANPRSKVTWDDVRFIRESNLTPQELAEEFGIAANTVRDIKAGRTWQEPRPDAAPGRDRGPARYTQYRLRNEGRWLLHGHTHQAEQRREGKEIHVGVDAWELAPVSLDTIAALMKEEQ